LTNHPNLTPAEGRRLALRKELTTIAAEQSRLRQRVRGRHLHRTHYLELIREQEELTRHKLALEVELSEIKDTVRQEREAAEQARNEAYRRKVEASRPRQFLDEHDLRNALMEPQTLLQRSYALLDRLLRQCGARDGDRALLESVRDYLQRAGVTV